MRQRHDNGRRQRRLHDLQQLNSTPTPTNKRTNTPTTVPTATDTPTPVTPTATPTNTVRILEGDLNLDCRVDVFDEAPIAMHFGSFFGSAFFNKWFDLEPSFHDLDIDIKDVQKVFGRDGSTCQNPIPAQTPVPPPFWLLS